MNRFTLFSIVACLLSVIICMIALEFYTWTYHQILMGNDPFGPYIPDWLFILRESRVY